MLFFIAMYNLFFASQRPEYFIEHNQTYQKLGLLRWEDGKDHSLPQDYADMLGWKELALKVDTIYSKLPNKANTLIICDNYGQAGAINYYTQLKAVSFNADYIDWFDLTKNYQNLIRVKELSDPDTELKETSPFFVNSRVAGSITNKYSREFGTLIFAFVGSNIDINNRIKNEIDKKKNYR